MIVDLSKLTESEILTLTIIGESRGEPIEGQIAVASVILNRSRKRKLSISKICLEPKQFSCWNNNDANRVVLEELAEKMIDGQGLTDPIYNQCQYIASGILFGKLLDNTHGSLNYITLSLWYSPNKPSWARNVSFAVSKGNQIFFIAS